MQAPAAAPDGCYVPRVTRQLTTIGSGILVGSLLIAVVLGYSGDATLAGTGGVVMILGVPLGVLVLLGAGISAIVTSSSTSSAPPATYPAAPPHGATIPEQRLAAAKRMHEAGDLTDEEYEAKRRQIIDDV